MQNRIKLFVKTLRLNWHWIFFVILFILATFFLFSGGIYNFSDSGYYYYNFDIAKKMLFSKLGLFSNTDGFYFGYDNSQRSFADLPVMIIQTLLTGVFGASIGQIVYYFFFFLITFYFGMKLFELIFQELSKSSIKIGALFLTYSPFSLLIVTLFSVGQTLPAFVVFVYSSLQYLRNGKSIHILQSLLSVLILIHYLRLIPIIFLVYIIVIALLWERRAEFLKFKRMFVLCLLMVMSIAPFIYGNIASLYSGSSIVSNYQSGFKRYEEYNYDFKGSFLFSLSNPGGFTPSALSYFYNPEGRPGIDQHFSNKNLSEFYKASQILFYLTFICIAIFLLKKSSRFTKDRLIFLIACNLLFIAVNTIGYFVSSNIFNYLNRSVLIFLYNDYGFMQFGQNFIFALIVVLVINEFSARKLLYYRFAIVVVLLFCFVNALPYVLNVNFYGLGKVKNIPKDFRALLLDGSMAFGREATLFVPYYWLKFSWTPHFINLNFFNDSRYESLIVPNFRAAGYDFINLYNNFYENTGNASFNNIRLFNIKSLILFKDIVDADGQIDTYGVVKKLDRLKNYEEQLGSMDGVSIASTFPTIISYRFNDADKYDYLLYVPSKVIGLDVLNFFSEKISNEGVVLLDEQTSDKDLSFDEGTALVSYKWGLNNSNKYYIHISNSTRKDKLLLQLNQMRSDVWNIYASSKEEFDGVACNDWSKIRVITNNIECHFKKMSLDFSDFTHIFDKPIDARRLDGNYFGNLFVIQDKGLVESANDSDGLYLKIVFKNQTYYELTLLLSFITLILVGILVSIEKIIFHFRKSS